MTDTQAHVPPRVVPGRNGGTLTPITSDNARAMVQRRLEKKRAIIRQAANEAVQRGDMRGAYGDDAYLAEIAATQQQLATTPDAGKAAVMAASWLVEHTGLAEPKRGDDSPTARVEHTLDPRVMALLERIASMPDTSVDIIDGRWNSTSTDVPDIFLPDAADVAPDVVDTAPAQPVAQHTQPAHTARATRSTASTRKTDKAAAKQSRRRGAAKGQAGGTSD